MYKIQICSKKHDDYGILVNPKEYVVNSAEDVCDILIALSSPDIFITLVELKVVSVDDIKRDFKLIP